MQLSLLQLNINADNFWDTLVSYLTTSDFDIIQLQEVTGKDSFSGNIHSTRDTFTELQKILDGKYNGELAVAGRFTSSPESYMGNATFYKKEFVLTGKQIVTLNRREDPFPSDATSFETAGRNMLHLKLVIDGKTVSFLNTHFAWAHTSQEEPHQTAQGEILVECLKTVPAPFVLTGDFNLNPRQPLIQKINSLAHNLVTEYAVTNTLNPRTHRAKEVFPQGRAVDYIFVSNDIKVKNFQVLSTLDLSDHFGLTARIEI